MLTIPNLSKKSLMVSNLQLHLNEMLLLTNRHVMDKRIPFYVVNIERSPELPFWLCIIESEPKALHWINSDKVGVYAAMAPFTKGQRKHKAVWAHCRFSPKQIHSFIFWENLRRANLLSVLSDL